ncbi:hypothetical protein CHARACLAT_004978, partial [Characodon lateralis]|nr:hypothetical protein [Characodon lateralis]
MSHVEADCGRSKRGKQCVDLTTTSGNLLCSFLRNYPADGGRRHSPEQAKPNGHRPLGVRGAEMSGGEVVCSGWLRKSPPEKKLRRY